jgi:hypothetical protein
MTAYQVSISMSAETVSALVASGNYLYVFRAVQSADLAARSAT